MTRATAFTAIAVAALVAIAFRFAPGTLTVRVQRSGSESAVTLRVRPSSLSDLQASTASALGLRSVATLYDAASGTALADVGAVVDGSELVAAAQPGDVLVWPSVAVGHVRSIALPDRAVELETLSLSPRVFRARGLVSDEELRELLRLSLPVLRPGKHGANSAAMDEGIVGRSHGEAIREAPRSAVTDALQARIAQLAGLTISQAEAVQVVRYQSGGAYWHHSDWLRSDERQTVRIATVLLYLNDGYSGGGTNFPHQQAMRAGMRPGQIFPHNCDEGLTVHGKKGDAVLWYNFDAQVAHAKGVIDRASIHAGCEVAEGEKWVANVWLHNK